MDTFDGQFICECIERFISKYFGNKFSEIVESRKQNGFIVVRYELKNNQNNYQMHESTFDYNFELLFEGSERSIGGNKHSFKSYRCKIKQVVFSFEESRNGFSTIDIGHVGFRLVDKDGEQVVEYNETFCGMNRPCSLRSILDTLEETNG